MSMHKTPLTPVEEAGFHAHGLQRNIGKPSQLADVFRQGVAWGLAAREAEATDQPHAAPVAWPIKGVRVDGDKVIVAVKGGNDAARWLCGELVALVPKR